MKVLLYGKVLLQYIRYVECLYADMKDVIRQLFFASVGLLSRSTPIVCCFIVHLAMLHVADDNKVIWLHISRCDIDSFSCIYIPGLLRVVCDVFTFV